MTANSEFVLALAPVSRGLGLFVATTNGAPIDWRVRELRERNHKNAHFAAAADQLLDEFRPVALILENHRARGSRRSQRVSELLDLIAELAEERGVVVARYGMRNTRSALGLALKANKDDIAAVVAERFPALKSRLPRRKRIWDTEAFSMPMFIAAALMLTHLERAKCESTKADAPEYSD